MPGRVRRKLPSKRLVLVLFITAAIGVLYYWQQRSADVEIVTRDSSRRVLRSTRVISQHQTPDTKNDSRSVSSWFFEAGISGRRISGIVFSDDAPLAGATVVLQSEYARLAERPNLTLLSDAEGAFDFGVQPATEYMVVATKTGMSGHGLRVNLRSPEINTESLRIELQPCNNWFVGQARNVYGDIVADGKVEAMAWIGKSWLDPMYAESLENDGSFAICAPTSEKWPLWISASGYGKQWLRTPMPIGGWQVLLTDRHWCS